MSKVKIFLFLILALVVGLGIWMNGKYEVVAVHPFFGGEDYELRVLTWNVHRSAIVDEEQQVEMAMVILAQEADVVQLNEFTLDSCWVLDSLLRQRYPYIEASNANLSSGDIIYSRKELFHSGQREVTDKSKPLPNYAMTFLCGKDSVYLVGVHLMGNNDSITTRQIASERDEYYRHFYQLYKERREDRKISAHHLKQWVMECPHAMIIMGDMNDFSVSAPLDSLRDAGMKNAWWEGGFGYGATFKQGWMRLRIDHIYYNDRLELKNIKVVETDLSDHNMLVADFGTTNLSNNTNRHLCMTCSASAPLPQRR